VMSSDRLKRGDELGREHPRRYRGELQVLAERAAGGRERRFRVSEAKCGA